jgi:hypothetical protein
LRDRVSDGDNAGMKRALLAIGLVGLTGTTVIADTALANYHRLRSRLTSEFTVVGDGPGESQPAPERMDNLGLMKWGDGTIALGFYLGVLATEHYMLAHPARYPGFGGNLEATRDELYFALRALERLDEQADAAFPAPCSSQSALNGFFLRDDVPENFHQHFPGISVIQSDFIDPTLTNKEESQDQVYHVQHGLALVEALVPDDVVVRGRPVRAWAIEQATRITQHFAKADWIIRNPACDDRAVNRGENAIGFSYGETLAAAYVTDGAVTPTTAGLWSSIWDTLKSPSNPTYSDEDNLHMALAIMAVGDGYGDDTAQVIAELSTTQDWPLYPLLHRTLHPDNAGFCATASTINPRVREMLDELPADGEPSCPGATPAVHGFTTHNRFIRGKSQAYVGPAGCEGVRYHGLDYLLLHNLYAIATPLTWNGEPDADPCAVLPEDPDEPGHPDGPDSPDPEAPAAGGCSAGGGASWLFGLGFLLIRRRAPTLRTSAACSRCDPRDRDGRAGRPAGPGSLARARGCRCG